MAEYIDRQEAILALLDSPASRSGLIWASDAMKRLSDVSIAEVAPVVHGRWIDAGGGYVACSECGEEHGWETYRASYCEDCGAKMDKEDK